MVGKVARPDIDEAICNVKPDPEPGARRISGMTLMLGHTESLRDAVRIKKPMFHGFFSVSRAI
jgi:hypothetical protein